VADGAQNQAAPVAHHRVVDRRRQAFARLHGRRPLARPVVHGFGPKVLQQVLALHRRQVGVAEHRQRRRIGVGHHPVVVNHQCERRHREQFAVAAFGGVHRLLQRHVGRDVARHAPVAFEASLRVEARLAAHLIVLHAAFGQQAPHTQVAERPVRRQVGLVRCQFSRIEAQ
jgi:hypothetical protein